jgi:hypothetical protein
MAQGKMKKLTGRATWTLLSIAAFSAIGGVPVMTLRNPGLAVRVSMVAAACAVIPFGIRSRSLLGGVLRGAGLGLVAGWSLASVLEGLPWIPRQSLSHLGATYLLATTAMCTVVAALFAHLAQRRRSLMQQPWE